MGGAIEGVQVLAPWPVRDDRRGPASEHQAAQRVAVIGAVGGQRGGGRQQGNQVRRDRRVAALAGCDGEGDQPARAVDQRMQLGRRSPREPPMALA